MTAHIRYMLGSISLKERDALIGASEDTETFYRLHVLIPIYFPKLHEDLSHCGSCLQKANQIANRFDLDLSDVPEDIKAFKEARKSFRESIVIFKMKLQKELVIKISE